VHRVQYCAFRRAVARRRGVRGSQARPPSALLSAANSRGQAWRSEAISSRPQNTTKMPAVLLGNGFSRAYDDELFDYDALRSAAALSERLEHIFDELETTDFELVMRRLSQALALLPHYSVPRLCRDSMRRDISIVRKSLIDALRIHHPSGANELQADQCAACAQFLRGFERIYTLNYDLLLYWVVVEHLRGQHNDGFGGNPLHWLGPNYEEQTVFYLHGALHLYDTGAQVLKLRYGGGTPILTQLREHMSDGEYPLFVSEGESSQKLSRIRSNPYLSDAYERLANNTLPLVIVGFKFGSHDNHIINAIARSQTPAVTVVLRTGGRSADRARIRERAGTMVGRIRLKNNAHAGLDFRESEERRIWG
jgi:Domain of unknown function (DUF4917)